MAVRKPLLGELLSESGLISQDQLAASLEEQKTSGDKLGLILVKKGFLTERQLLEALEFHLGIPQVQISKMKIDPDAVKLLPPQLIRKHCVLPVARTRNTITLAMADPLDQRVIDDVRMASSMDVIPVIASPNDLEVAIRQYLAFRLDQGMERILKDLNQENHNAISSRRDQPALRMEDDAPVIRMVNSILAQGVQGRCSDVHIEPREEDVRVRFRVDGELYEVLTLPRSTLAAAVSRIKIMANMDIAEKRVPQDGRFRMFFDQREVDFRVSTLPTVHGEKVALRILDRENSLSRVEQLSLSKKNQELVLELARRPHGMVLASGPTGSGKTSTLYAILTAINSVERNIITLEDPVEYSLENINQVQINPKAGLTFAGGLRSILRQDPDVVMVGEIRDNETAQLAVQAAMTGHLVLSTLHTNSAAGTVARLSDMGVENFLQASSLAGVISQRLVRKLCPNCRQVYKISEATAARLGIPDECGQEFYRPVGCHMCRQLGYQGRMAIQEILVLGPEVRTLITQGENAENVIESAAVREGMVTIKNDGIAKAKQGLTSLEEVMKVVLLGG